MNTETSHGFLLLYALYNKAPPEKKQNVLAKLTELTDFSTFIELLNQTGFFQVNDTNTAGKNIDFLIELILAFSAKKEKISCVQFINYYFMLLEKKADPSSYPKYSEFLKIIFTNISQESKKQIFDKILTIDRIIALYPMAHFGMVHNEYMTQICNIILSIVPKIVATKNTDIWNETVLTIFSSSESNKLDKYTTYSAIDLVLSTKSNLDQKFNLFYNSFKYFTQQEMTQLLRIHFDANAKQLTKRSSSNAICKAIETGIEFSTLEGKPQILLDLVVLFAKLYRNDPKMNASYEHLIQSIQEEKIDATVLPLFENEETSAAFYYYASCVQTKKILHYVVLPVQKEQREFQYACVIKLLNNKKIDVSLAAYMLSMLHTKDIALTSYIVENSPADFLSCTIRYLEGAVDYEKAVAISRLIQSIKKVPTVNSSGIDTAFGTVSTFFFSFGSGHLDLLKLLEYFIACHSSKSEFDFDKAKAENWSDITKQIDDEWRPVLIDSALVRIRKGENKQSVFLMAISNTSIALEQAIKALKGNTESLAALFTASIIAHQSDTIALMDLMLKEEDEENKNRGIIGNLLGTSEKPLSIRRSLIFAVYRVATYLEPTNRVLICLSKLLKGAQELDETKALISIIPIILRSSIEKGNRGDFTPFFAQLITREVELTANTLERPLIALINSSSTLEQNIANDISALWVRHIEKFEVMESEVESAMLGGTQMGPFATALSLAYSKNKIGKCGLLSIKRSIESVPDPGMFVSIAPTLIGLSLTSKLGELSIELIKKICKISTATMDVPKKMATALYLDSVIPFYSAIVNSLGFSNAVKVAYGISASRKPRGIFEYAIINAFPGDTLKTVPFFVDFFVTCGIQNVELWESLSRGFNRLANYDATLFLQLFFGNVAPLCSKEIFSLVGMEPLIANSVLDYLDASVIKPIQPDLLVCFAEIVIESIAHGNLSSSDIRVRFAYLILLSTGYISRLKLVAKQKILFSDQMTAINERLFPGSKDPKVKVYTDSEFVEAIGNLGDQILMHRSDQIRSFLERVSILKGTQHSFAYILFISLMARTCGHSKLRDPVSKAIYANAVSACSAMNGKPANEFSIILSTIVEASPGCLPSASQATTIEAFNLLLRATQTAKAGSGQFELLVKLALQLPTADFVSQIQPIIVVARKTTPRERLFIEDFFKLLIRIEGQKHDQHLLARDLPQLIEPTVAAIGLGEPMASICSEYLRVAFKAQTTEAALRSLCESTVATYKTPNYYSNGVQKVTAALSPSSSREAQRIASVMTAALAGYPQHHANKEAVVESIVAHGSHLDGAELEAYISDLFQ